MCYMHGGKTPKGIASPQFKNGRYSKYLPQGLLEKYHESVADPELLNMRHEIAICDARLSELLKRSDTGEAGRLWEQAQTANDNLQKAMDDENYGAVALQCRILDRLIGEGLTDYEAWHEIAQLLEQRRKLAESEQKRLVAMQQTITSEEAMTLVMALTQSVRRYVHDPATLNSIQTDFIQFTSRNNRDRVNA